MSAVVVPSETIEILDDEDDQIAVSVAIAQSQKIPDEDNLRKFLEVTESQNRAWAIATLQEVQWDLSKAIATVFQDQANGTASTTTTTTTTTLVTRNHPNCANKHIHTAKYIELSQEWNLCMTQTSGIFVDPDFPPIQSSLDGRKRTSKSEQQAIIKCPCGIPAAARTVQSEGPNYGRFYLGCGNKKKRTDSQRTSYQQCKFFQWDDRNGSQGAGYSTRFSLMAWESFQSPHCCMMRKEISPNAVRQGAIGNCWFLSALAVVAEKPYLIQRVLPHRELNTKGCYQVNLCLNGQWTPIIVDSNLPVIYREPYQNQAFRGGIPSSISKQLIAIPVFSAIPDGQLWPALIEKAYAKAHGSYEQLSGGFIQEAFYDMTGAPTETIIFSACWHVEELWARLLSFSEAGFIMGVATNKSGDGLVGHHAYSVLQVLEIHDALVGEQQCVTDFFSNVPEKNKNSKKQKSTIRLVRIRNPWGKKEWNGDFSDNSNKWTTALRSTLGKGGFVKNDGTFWMSYEDMMQRFHHMDVAKCREGWKHISMPGCFPATPRDPFMSSRHCYRLKPSKKSWAFVSIVQPKKRANTKSKFWYADPSMLIMKKKKTSDIWSSEAVVLHGFTRCSVCEIFLDPEFEYCCLPLSTKSWARLNEVDAPFCITCYSAEIVGMEKIPHQMVVSRNRDALSLIHRHLITNDHKLMYVVSSKALLVCCTGYRCLYFLVINSSPEYFVSLRLQIELKKGFLISYGENNATHDIPKRSMKIILVVSSDGTDSSAISISFKYSSDVIKSAASETTISRVPAKFDSLVDISLAADLMAHGIDTCSCQNKGGGTIDIYQWLSQVGAAL